MKTARATTSNTPGVVTIDGYNERGDARCSCTCGARWWRSKVRHNYALSFTCPDCHAPSPYSLALTSKPKSDIKETINVRKSVSPNRLG